MHADGWNCKREKLSQAAEAHDQLGRHPLARALHELKELAGSHPQLLRLLRRYPEHVGLCVDNHAQVFQSLRCDQGALGEVRLES